MPTLFRRILLVLLCLAAPATAQPYHSADTNPDYLISLSELLRVIQFYNVGALHCDPVTEDGFAPAPGDQTCLPHNSDYAPQDWAISLSELLRLIQIYNTPGYRLCQGQNTEDGFCPGLGEGEGEEILIADPALDAALRDALGIPFGPLTPDILAGLTELRAPHAAISTLAGIEACTGLLVLDLANNCISDLTPLTGLLALEQLNLHANIISDLAPLVGLTNLRLLWLDHNQIADPTPLLDNPGLGQGPENTWDRVALAFNPLDALGADTAVDMLRARSVSVWANSATATACTSPYLEGDPTPIDVHLIHGNPDLDDAQAFVLVLLGDAYTEAQLDDPTLRVADAPANGYTNAERTWAKSAADAMRFLFTQEPFTEYASYFKVYRVDLLSAEGTLSDNRSEPPLVYDTALNMARETLAFSFDNEQVHRIANATGIPWDHIVLLPNSDGSGKNIDDVTMFSNARFSRTMTGLHELGHGLGKLTDEYEYRHGTNPPTSDPIAARAFPNAISTASSIPTWEDIPWRHWLTTPCDESVNQLGDPVDFDCLDPECQCEDTADYPECTPLPTCEPDGNFVAPDGKIYGRAAWPEPSEDSPVGLFEGAWFRSKGAYRPELRCRMRSDDDVEPGGNETPRFCKVCREALNLEIVDNTGCAAAWSPSTTQPLVLQASDPPAEFNVALHTPAREDHEIEIVAWQINGIDQPGAFSPTFQVDPANLEANAVHTVSVTLGDRSPFVHPDYAAGQQRLTQLLTWTLHVE